RPRYDYVEEIYLKKGMNGNDVKTLQENLLLVGFADCGYYSNPSTFCDGSFGDITEKSVLALQKSCGLEEDGIYGNESNKALNELLKNAKNSKLSLNVANFLKIAKETTDYVKGWNYGNAAFLPSVYKYEHLASCDRLVDMILWNAGLKDVGNRNVGALEKYLSNYQGVKKVTKLTDVKAGDIVFLTGHVFLVGNKKENGMYERYDGGSDARLKSDQPFVEPINGFVCAYRLPFVTDAEINKDKKLNLVKCGQVHLNNYIHANLEVDGEYGKNTRKAFIKAIQTALNRSHGCGLIVDGDFGAKTESALKKYVVMLNTKSDLATVLGIGLYINGIEPYGLVANDKMIKALKTYQKQYNLEVDGVAGVLTFKSLATIK
ncbi:MAG: peptidoglycan-binding protein, partial [Bacteroidaceae bacterium]|nr:peptidoglycan-binding protein [Bacteroidaceae bacterium]